MSNKYLVFIATSITIISTVFFFLNRSNVEIKDIQGSIDPHMLIHNIELSSEVYESFAKNNEYWKNNDVSRTLIYRYPEDMCGNCYYEDIEELLNLQDEIGSDRILVLPAFEDNRDNKIHLKNKLSKFNFQNVSIGLLTIPEYKYDKSLQRYFAVIDKDKEIEMIFFPHLGRKDLTQLYFSEVKKRMK